MNIVKKDKSFSDNGELGKMLSKKFKANGLPKGLLKTEFCIKCKINPKSEGSDLCGTCIDNMIH